MNSLARISFRIFHVNIFGMNARPDLRILLVRLNIFSTIHVAPAVTPDARRHRIVGLGHWESPSLDQGPCKSSWGGSFLIEPAYRARSCK